MALINFNYRVDITSIPGPTDPSGYILAYDLDGVLKQKDYNGNISIIGGSQSNASGGDQNLQQILNKADRPVGFILDGDTLESLNAHYNLLQCGALSGDTTFIIPAVYIPEDPNYEGGDQAELKILNDSDFTITLTPDTDVSINGTTDSYTIPKNAIAILKCLNTFFWSLTFQYAENISGNSPNLSQILSKGDRLVASILDDDTLVNLDAHINLIECSQLTGNRTLTIPSSTSFNPAQPQIELKILNNSDFIITLEGEAGIELISDVLNIPKNSIACIKAIDATKYSVTYQLDGLGLQDSLNINESGDKVKFINRFTFNSGNGFSGLVFSVVEIGSGIFVCVGDFTQYKGIGVNRIVMIDQSGNIVPSFNIGNGFEGTGSVFVNKIFKTNQDVLICVGDFQTYNGETVNNVVALNLDGTINTNYSFGSGFNGAVLDVLIYNNKFYFGGFFSQYDGNPSSRIAAVNFDGSIDSSFALGTGFNDTSITQIRKILIYNDKIYAFGFFSSYNGTARNSAVSLNLDGSINTTFNVGSGFNNAVLTAMFDENFNIYVGGDFSTYKGVSQNRIVKVNLSGTVDSIFNTGTAFNNAVFTIGFINNNLLIGGNFSSYKGFDAQSAIIIATNGNIVNTNFNCNSTVFDHLVTINGNILLVGSFFEYNSITISRGIILTDMVGNYTIINDELKLSFNRNNNGIAEYFTIKTFDELEENELLNKKTIVSQFGKLISLTTTEILAIANPEQGRLYYNSTINEVVFYNGNNWRKLSHSKM